MKMLTKYGAILLGILLGGVAGYSYYAYIGCSSGTCAITSRPLNSTVYGAIMGGLLANILKDFLFTKKRQSNEHSGN